VYWAQRRRNLLKQITLAAAVGADEDVDIAERDFHLLQRLETPNSE